LEETESTHSSINVEDNGAVISKQVAKLVLAIGVIAPLYGIIGGNLLANAGFGLLPVLVLYPLALIPLSAYYGLIGGVLIVTVVYVITWLRIDQIRPRVVESGFIWLLAIGFILNVLAIIVIYIIGHRTVARGS